jgi:hypothetical protein
MIKLLVTDLTPQFQPLSGLEPSSAHSPGCTWGDEKEVLKVSKLDPILIPLQFYYFKNNNLTIL